MPIIDRIKLPSGNIYILADSDAQSKLENVYTKSETYTRAEVLAAIAEAMKGGYLAVNTLPTASEDTLGHIYLVPDPDGSGDNVRIEYVTVQSGSSYTWEKLGTTELNLDNLELEKGSGDMVLGENTTFTASQPPVDISGGASDTVLGEDTTFSVTQPTISVTPSTTNVKATATGTAVGASSTDTFVKSYPGATGKLVTTTVPNVTGNTQVTANKSNWSFAMGTGAESTTLIISGGNGSDVTATNTTLGTAITAATGAVSSNGAGSSVMTGLGTATTGTAVTGVQVTSQPTVSLSTGAAAGTGVVSVATGISSASASGAAVTAMTNDRVTAVTNVGTAALRSAPTITVGTNDKVKVAKYDDLELQKP